WGHNQLPTFSPTRLGRVGPSKFERTEDGWVESAWTPEPVPIFVGVMPADTSLAAAECALETSPTCTPQSAKLKLSAVVGIKLPATGFAKLVQLDNRFVVLIANNADLLKKATLSSRVTSAIHAEADGAMARRLGWSNPLPGRLVSDVTAEGTQ